MTQKQTKKSGNPDNRKSRIQQAQKLVSNGYCKHRAALIMSVKPHELKGVN